MTNAFSVLSLKRNRSTATHYKSSGSSTAEPVNKLSKLKSGFSIFSKKLAHSISSHHHEHLNNNTKRSSPLIELFYYFRGSNDQSRHFDNDIHYEYNHYYNNKKKRRSLLGERNIHTLPTISPEKLTSILIKRSGTSPSAIKSYNKQASPTKKIETRKRTLSNATISNMTINSEDLTAKEFADIVGIRILPEEKEVEEERKYISDVDTMYNTVSTRFTTAKEQRQHEILSLLSYTSLLSTSYSTSTHNNAKLKIWDNEFWLNPEVITSPSRSNSTRNNLDRRLSTASSKVASIMLNEPPILHELRRMNSSTNSDCVIKKGRFEIHLSPATNDSNNTFTTAIATNVITPTVAVAATTEEEQENNLPFSENQHVEWKRKEKTPIVLA